MTPREFKAWFEGFTEAFDRLPTKAQWAHVKERVAEIDGRETAERVYVDRYINRYWPLYPYYGSQATMGGNVNQASQYQGALNNLGQAGNQFSSLNAMGALGRAEAQLLTQKTGDHHG